MQQVQQLFQKYKEQSATEAELHELLSLLDKKEEKLLHEWMEQKDRRSEAANVTFEKQKIRAAIMDRIGAVDPAQLTIIPAKRNAKAIRKMWGALAAACISILILLGVMYKADDGREKTIMSKSISNRQAIPTFRAQEKNRHIILEDSSSVLLYKGSSLEYVGRYNSADRQLRLKGTALFKVKKDANRPFIVVTRHNATTALGTVFEVKEWDDSTTVYLSEGRVKVHTAANDNDVRFLEPGDRATTFRGRTSIEKNNSKNNNSNYLQPKADPSTAKAKKAALVFKQTPLNKVLVTLQAKYQVKIQFSKEELSGMLFTGVISENDRIEDVLAIMATVHHLAISTYDQGFIINK